MALIEPGERIPVDGIVRRSLGDQAPITGESIPVDKVVGDKVFAGTLNQQGALDVEAAGAANDTVLARVIKMVEEAQDSKAPTERFLDRLSRSTRRRSSPPLGCSSSCRRAQRSILKTISTARWC
ncbi:MAG: hypothetical protein U0670_21995 [Anaerolineae bacterium]